MTRGPEDLPNRLDRSPGLKPPRVWPALGDRPATPPWTSAKRWPLQPLRRLVQLGFVVALVLLPLLDVFRIDTPGRYMVIFGQPVLLSEFYFLLLAILVFIFFFSAVTVVLGRVWCGWLCPQTIFYEVIGPVGRWIMGQRSQLLRGALLLVAATVLGLIAVATAFFMLSYFVAPVDLLGWLRQGQVPVLIGVVLAGLTGAIVLDGVLLREKFCIYACPYGLIQSFLTDQDTLRIRFETEYATDCVNCYACSLVCPVHL